MDFVILKVNGQDVSNSSHEEAVRCFQSAQEPILVEVLRRYPAAEEPPPPPPPPDESEEPSRGDGAEEKTFTLLVSTGVQTEWAGLIDDEDLVPVTLHADEQTCNDSFDDILGPEIDFEEVTLRRSGSAEKLGLTVCYSSAGSGSEDADTEVYISEIVPESLAARDGRLREGDQILRVNGKDVASKEQTESLFAETESDVTILVSRCCLYTDDDEDERRACPEGSPTTPAYQNSMIEQLIRQQQDGDEAAKDSEPTSEAPPPVPSHVQLAFSDPSSTCSSQKSSGCGPDIAEQQQQQQQQQRKKWMQEALKECARRVDNIKLGATESPQQHKSAVKLAEAYSSHVWSDTEHIYETIPESDSEPIYSSPYEHRHWPYEPGNNQQSCPAARQPGQPGQPKPSWHCSSKSNSSGEEKDSSSAYNTGESCNSNTLTLELQQPSEHHRSTLVLCPPTPSAPCNCPVPLAPPPAKSAGGKLQQVARRGPPDQQQQQHVLAAETMYTNAANLQQTMRLQQQLFKQALSSRRKSGVVRDACYARRSRAQTAAFQAPSLAQYQFVASHQVSGPTTPVASSPQQQQQQEPVQMEWKVKRRPDGSRYITRRPVRNRILRNRALRINEERQGHTTEDDAVSEIKVGRYWSKEERKRQLERAKERKQRQQQELIQQQQQQSSDQLIYDYSEDSKTLKNSPNSLVEQAHKKTTRKKQPADDFAAVQEILVHGNRVGSATQNPAGKLMGLLSVTTV